MTRPDDEATWGKPRVPGAADIGSDPGATEVPGAAQDVGSVFIEYAGPPASSPPLHHWRPPQVVAPFPPRQLPEQDHGRLDIEEQAADTLTKGIGLVVGATLLVLLLILCARGVIT